MNILPSARVLLPLLLCAATSPVLAGQSGGVIHFQGRIIAPVCNDALSPEARAAFADRHPAAGASAADMDGCGGTSNTVISTTSVSSREQRTPEYTTGADSKPAKGYTPDRVWTVTYQ